MKSRFMVSAMAWQRIAYNAIRALRTRRRETSTACQARTEPLEPRSLFSAHIVAVAADNRGWVVLSSDQALDRTTLNTSSITMFASGADSKFGTADDAKIKIGVYYNQAQHKVTLKAPANLAANVRYRVRLIGAKIKSLSGGHLDGEFNGASKPSGNGTDGGNFDFFAKPASGDVTARITSLLGTINVRLFGSKASLKPVIDNFAFYANLGFWDSTFFDHAQSASAGAALIRAGGVNLKLDNTLSLTPVSAPIPLAASLANTRGTIAMHHPAGSNASTNEWFFNDADNPSLNGHFTVFGKVSAPTLATLDALMARPRVEIHADPNVPANIKDAISPSSGGVFARTLPIRSQAAFDARSGVLDPRHDVLLISRVALAMNVFKT